MSEASDELGMTEAEVDMFTTAVAAMMTEKLARGEVVGHTDKGRVVTDFTTTPQGPAEVFVRTVLVPDIKRRKAESDAA